MSTSTNKSEARRIVLLARDRVVDGLLDEETIDLLADAITCLVDEIDILEQKLVKYTRVPSEPYTKRGGKPPSKAEIDAIREQLTEEGTYG